MNSGTPLIFDPVANMASLGVILPSVIVPSFVVVSAISAFAVYRCRSASSSDLDKKGQLQSVYLLAVFGSPDSLI